MRRRSQEFYRLYGSTAVQQLEDQIVAALGDRNDKLALELHGLLLEIEQLIYGSMPQAMVDRRTLN